MKALLLTNEYPPNVYGGAGVHVDYLSRALAALPAGDLDVEVRCFDAHSASDREGAPPLFFRVGWPRVRPRILSPGHVAPGRAGRVALALPENVTVRAASRSVFSATTATPHANPTTTPCPLVRPFIPASFSPGGQVKPAP